MATAPRWPTQPECARQSGAPERLELCDSERRLAARAARLGHCVCLAAAVADELGMPLAPPVGKLALAHRERFVLVAVGEVPQCHDELADGGTGLVEPVAVTEEGNAVSQGDPFTLFDLLDVVVVVQFAAFSEHLEPHCDQVADVGDSHVGARRSTAAPSLDSCASSASRSTASW